MILSSSTLQDGMIIAVVADTLMTQRITRVGTQAYCAFGLDHIYYNRLE